MFINYVSSSRVKFTVSSTIKSGSLSANIHYLQNTYKLTDLLKSVFKVSCKSINPPFSTIKEIGKDKTQIHYPFHVSLSIFYWTYSNS